MPAHLENSAVATGLETVHFQRKAMQKNAQTPTQLHISHASKVMLKILQARLQQYVNRELRDVQAAFRKRQRNQRSNCQHPPDHRNSKGIPAKHLLCFIDYTKVFDCVDNNKLANS